MPILQTRLQSLILAATDYQQAFRRAIDQVNAAVRRAKDYRQDPSELYNELLTLSLTISSDSLMSCPVESPITIALEADHFRRYGARNRSAAARARAKRITTGTPYDPQGPSNIPRASPIQIRLANAPTLDDETLAELLGNTSRAEGAATTDGIFDHSESNDENPTD